MGSSTVEKYCLLGIILLAASLRLFSLESIPPGFYSDEASIAYDAYSITLTGKDRFGVFVPLYPRGFDFWISGLRTYIAIPFINSLGLNEIGSRFPSALCGILTVSLVYAILKLRFDVHAALWASLLLAISPWHVHLSRIGTEYILLPFFFTLGLFLFFKGLKKRGCLYLSAAMLGLSIYTYIPARIFVPMTLAGLLLIYRAELRGKRTSLIVAGCIIITLLIPTVIFAVREPGHFFLRYTQIPLTAGGKSFIGSLLVFARNYLSHLSPVFLFLKGDANVRNFPQGFGQLYLFELPLIAAGIIACFKKWKNPDARFLIFWLLVYGIPSSLTTENIPHGLRTITALPLYQILGAIGIVSIGTILRPLRGWHRLTGYTLVSALALLAVWNISAFGRHYFLSYPVYSARAWDYGWREGMEYAISVENNYDRIVLTVLSVGPPTMYPPFYLRYDPAEYQRSKLEKSKYQFMTPEVMPKLFTTLKGRTLYIVREEELRGVPPLKIIHFPDGRIAFKIIEKAN